MIILAGALSFSIGNSRFVSRKCPKWFVPICISRLSDVDSLCDSAIIPALFIRMCNLFSHFLNLKMLKRILNECHTTLQQKKHTHQQNCESTQTMLDPIFSWIYFDFQTCEWYPIERHQLSPDHGRPNKCDRHASPIPMLFHGQCQCLHLWHHNEDIIVWITSLTLPQREHTQMKCHADWANL